MWDTVLALGAVDAFCVLGAGRVVAEGESKVSRRAYWRPPRRERKTEGTPLSFGTRSGQCIGELPIAYQAVSVMQRHSTRSTDDERPVAKRRDAAVTHHHTILAFALFQVSPPRTPRTAIATAAALAPRSSSRGCASSAQDLRRDADDDARGSQVVLLGFRRRRPRLGVPPGPGPSHVVRRKFSESVCRKPQRLK